MKILSDSQRVRDPDIDAIDDYSSGQVENNLVSGRNYADEEAANQQDLRNAQNSAAIFRVRLWNYYCLPVILLLLGVILIVLLLNIFGVIQLPETTLLSTGAIGATVGIVAAVDRLLRRQY